MAVVASTLIDPETLAEPGEVWQPTALLLPDGGQAMEVRTAWRTSVSRALSSAETRRALRDRPSRQVAYRSVGWRDSEALHLRQLLADQTRAGTIVPLWPDAAPLDANAGATDTTLSCDTAYRRFQTGARVAVVRRSGSYRRQDSGYLLATVDSVAAGTITLTGQIGEARTAGDLVVPVIEAALEKASSIRYDNADMAAATYDAGEIPGPSALEPSVSEKDWPAAYQTHDSLPILHLAGADGSCDVSVESISTIDPLGLGIVVTRAEGRPLGNWSLGAMFLKRSDAFDLLELFDAARGRCHAFWWVPALRDFAPTGVTTADVTVPAIGAERAWDDRPYIAVLLRDGTIYIRGVSSVIRSGGGDTVTLDAALPAINIASVKAVSIAHKARFASDEIVERWTNSTTCEVQASLVELQDDSTVATTIAAETSGNPASTAADGCGVSAAPPGLDENYLQHWWRSDSAYIDGANGVTVPDEGAGNWFTGEKNDIVEGDTLLHLDGTVNGLQAVGVTGTTPRDAVLSSPTNDVWVARSATQNGPDSSTRFSIFCVQATDDPSGNSARLNEFFSGASIQAMTVNDTNTRLWVGATVWTFAHPAGPTLWEIHQTGLTGTGVRLFVNGSEVTPAYDLKWTISNPWTERLLLKPYNISSGSLWCEKLTYCGHPWDPDSAEIQEARDYLVDKWGL